MLAGTLLRRPSALLGRDPVLRHFRALLLALTAGLAGYLTIFTHIDSPARTSRLSHADFLGPANKTGRFPGPPISSLRLTFRCRPEENSVFPYVVESAFQITNLWLSCSANYPCEGISVSLIFL
jgi:hypothetical protein